MRRPVKAIGAGTAGSVRSSGGGGDPRSGDRVTRGDDRLAAGRDVEAPRFGAGSSVDRSRGVAAAECGAVLVGQLLNQPD